MKNVKSVFWLVALMLFIGLTGCKTSMKSSGGYPDRMQSMTVVKHIALGCYLYSEDNQGAFPSDLADIVEYVEIEFTPSDFELKLPGKKLSEVKNPSGDVMIIQKRRLQNNETVVGFADGSVRILKESEIVNLH